MLAVLCSSCHPFAGIALQKFRIGNIVALCVDDRITDCSRVQLNSNSFARLRGRNQSDGSDAAVRINDTLISGQTGKLNRTAI